MKYLLITTIVIATATPPITAARDPSLHRAIVDACSAPYPADAAFASLLDTEGETDDLRATIEAILLSDSPPGFDSEFTGNILRLIQRAWGPSEHIRGHDALIAWVLRAATPGNTFRGEALGVLARADPSYDPLIGQHVSAWLTAPDAGPIAIYAMIDYVAGKPLPLSPGALAVVGRVAFDPDFAKHVSDASSPRLTRPEFRDLNEHESTSKIAEKHRQGRLHDLRGAAMAVRLRNGLAEHDLAQYAGLDVGGRAAAGHVLLGVLSGESGIDLWSKEDELLRVIGVARELFMDPTTHDKLEASPIGLWMFGARRDDVSVEVRRAMLQAMLDNAVVTRNAEIIGYARAFIEDSGFDPAGFAPRP